MQPKGKGFEKDVCLCDAPVEVEGLEQPVEDVIIII